ncbi:MAG: AmmeMemoRadiSam system protein A [candidate division KSB1 bacterium]|nr:AmmeMemoRadiSam system protein A [candidate division KSB1 bacterium]
MVTTSESRLSPEDKQQLLEIARKTIEAILQGKRPPQFPVKSPALQENRGSFVTLKKQGKLRGCIGYIEPLKPLAQTVQEMAEAAALRDPRFPPVSPEELKELVIEISALTPLRKIDRIEEIEVGKHGLFIKRGYYQGLLLPQVACEYHWDRETFLEQTCHKAGLPAEAWKEEDTEIYLFSAEVFKEGEG